MPIPGINWEELVKIDQGVYNEVLQGTASLITKFNRDLVELEKELAEGDSKELQSS